MIIRLIGGEEFTVSKQRGAEIAEGIKRNKDGWVGLGNGMVRAHQIVAIIDGGEKPVNELQINPPVVKPIRGSLKNKLRKERPEVYKRLYGK